MWQLSSEYNLIFIIYYINYDSIICNEALGVFGFIRHNCTDFKNPHYLKILYFSLTNNLYYDCLLNNLNYYF